MVEFVLSRVDETHILAAVEESDEASHSVKKFFGVFHQFYSTFSIFFSMV